MKVRVGIGGSPTSLRELRHLADAIATHRFDSIWLPEILGTATLDPVVALATVAAGWPSMKLGATMQFTGANTARLAKRLASLDVVSDGRLLLVAIPGIATGAEPGAIGVDPRRGGPVVEDVLDVCRQLWAGERVTHDGPAGAFVDLAVEPRPVQQPLEVWLGGTAPNSLLRCGRIGDGWLPARLTPDQAAAGRAAIEAEASRCGRAISDEHFGVSIGYFATGAPPSVLEAVAARVEGRPVADVVPSTLDEVASLLERFIAVGFSKFVLRPLHPVEDWDAELARLGAAVGHLQT